MDFGPIFKDIGYRLLLQRQTIPNNHNCTVLEETVSKYTKGQIKLRTLISRIRGVTKDFPDLWYRFYSLIPPEQMLHTLIPKRAPSPLTVSLGKFHLSLDLFQLHLLPLLSYPSVGRLVSTCKWMRVFIGPRELSEAMQRYRSRTYGRFEVLPNQRVRLWTTNEQPLVLHSDAHIMQFNGHIFRARSGNVPETFIQMRWPHFTLVREDDGQFVTVFRALLLNKNMQICVTGGPVDSRGTVTFHFSVTGGDFKFGDSSDAVCKFTVEFLPLGLPVS